MHAGTTNGRRAYYVSIPFRYGTTRLAGQKKDINKVSIPFRYGTTAAENNGTRQSSYGRRCQFLLGTVQLQHGESKI